MVQIRQYYGKDRIKMNGSSRHLYRIENDKDLVSISGNQRIKMVDDRDFLHKLSGIEIIPLEWLTSY